MTVAHFQREKRHNVFDTSVPHKSRGTLRAMRFVCFLIKLSLAIRNDPVRDGLTIGERNPGYLRVEFFFFVLFRLRRTRSYQRGKKTIGFSER